MGETRQLARFIAGTAFDDLPTDLVERAKVYVLDNLAAGFAGSVQPWSRMAVALVEDLGGSATSSVFGQSRQADVSRAAFVNGVMMGAFEVEHIGHVAHASGTVFPATLALAERNHTDGRQFLLAMLLGYEVVNRVGEAQTAAVERERGFHNPGANGVFGAAASAGKLLGLDEERQAWALGIAGSHSSGLIEFVWEGAMTKRMHLGRASQMGMESALLAEKGYTGPTTVLEGKYGYLQAFSPKPYPERLVSGLGQEWISRDLVIKAYPCHATGQAVVHAIQQLKQERSLDPASIDHVVITTDSHAAESRYQDREPETLLGGQYSLPFTTAVALNCGLADPLAFNDETLWDSTVRALSKKVEIAADDERFGGHGGRAAELVIHYQGERITLQAESFPGSLQQPLDFDGAVDKFRRYSAHQIDEAQADAIVRLVGDTMSLGDVSELARLIRA